MLIYTDPEQCNLFGAKYSEPGEVLVCSAEALLKSKKGDSVYDRVHRDYLKSLGSKTIVLERTKDCGPGWWEVSKIV